MHTTNDEENGDDVDYVEDDDDDDEEADDEDEDVEEWGGRWRECDAYTPRSKKNNQNYLIMLNKSINCLMSMIVSLTWNCSQNYIQNNCLYQHRLTKPS